MKDFLRFIRFSHTVFALPFALGAMFVAAGGLPTLRVVLGVLAAMVFARTAAMTFNRLADWEIDRRNPRTAGRHRLASRPVAIAACVFSSAGFVLSAWWLNPLCLALSPVALGIVFFYSLTKRFTHFAQFFLGLALATAPVGAWLAVTGVFALAPLVLAVAVLLWVAGFDLIYATQDYEVDLSEGLRSMVVLLGVPGALRLAVWLHAAAFLGLAAFGFAAGLGRFYFSSLAIVLAALAYEHIEARRGDVESINRAFFQANTVVGIAFVAGTLLDRLA
ncbi:MAG: 4-hydroxybenzoate octaprenyltransferase [Verrucomicrobiaceae bacterium]|nr:MAG: 4-hydroxybenzoate octaprenyltransferase [Verrucomicrobiaceae bacterium]